MDKLWIVLGLLAALTLAGCSFKGGGTGGDNGATLSATGGDNDKKDSPGAGLVEMVAVLGVALLVRRRISA